MVSSEKRSLPAWMSGHAISWPLGLLDYSSVRCWMSECVKDKTRQSYRNFHIDPALTLLDVDVKGKRRFSEVKERNSVRHLLFEVETGSPERRRARLLLLRAIMYEALQSFQPVPVTVAKFHMKTRETCHHIRPAAQVHILGKLCEAILSYRSTAALAAIMVASPAPTAAAVAAMTSMVVRRFIPVISQRGELS